MTFHEVLTIRRSVRNYASQEIEPDKLDYILESARLAPSACNMQPWIFIVVREPANREKLQVCYGREWFKTAPVYIIACADHQQSWKRKFDEKDHADVDLSIAIEHICLAAAEKGLGTCWVCNFDTDLCKKEFNLPEHIEPIALLPLGYPDKQHLPQPTPRKNIFDIVRWEKF